MARLFPLFCPSFLLLVVDVIIKASLAIKIGQGANRSPTPLPTHLHTPCADPESFVRGGLTLAFFFVICFLVDEGRID